MKTSDFSYHLPKEYIAQKPAQPRDSSRLLVYQRETGITSHHHFFELPDLLRASDVLVVNKTRVLHARLFGKKIHSGGKCEILLLEKEQDQVWQCMVGGKGLRPGVKIQLDKGPKLEIKKELEGPLRVIEFSAPIEPYLEDIGYVPLPPYIHESLEDPEKYQTVFSKVSGSAAAPTAGLHFTKDLIKRLQYRGIQITEVTLHVGLDTFAPVRVNDPREHPIHSEWCSITPKTAAILNRTRKQGGRIIAVGTTTARTLETAAQASKNASRLSSYQGLTDLYILPGYQFLAVDCLITNFHLPESTLLMMVSAFVGRETILSLYETAKRKGYRFYSFGDAMLLE